MQTNLNKNKDKLMQWSYYIMNHEFVKTTFDGQQPCVTNTRGGQATPVSSSSQRDALT